MPGLNRMTRMKRSYAGYQPPHPSSPPVPIFAQKGQRDATVSPYLQNTPKLLVTVADLGVEPQRVCSDRPVSDPVVVSLCGQLPRIWPLRPEANARCDVPPISLRLTCPAPSVGVLRRPVASLVVVTHLVTHPGQDGSAELRALHHLPRTNLAVSDVVRRLVERGASQLLMAAFPQEIHRWPMPLGRTRLCASR
jgi:hypothetical protein